MRNVYFCYIDVNAKKTYLLEKDDIVELNTIDILSKIEHKEAIIFTNYLSVFTERYKGGEKYGETYTKHGQDETLQYTYQGYTFRNISSLCNGQLDILRDLYPNTPTVIAIKEYVLSICDPYNVKRINQIPYTLGQHVKKVFYEPISDSLYEIKKQQKTFYYDYQDYQDLSAYNKGSLIMDEQTYSTDVSMYDLKSAYPAVFLTDNIFPIGKINKIVVDTYKTALYCIDEIKDRLTNKQWFKVVFDGKMQYLEDFYDEDSNKTALEYYSFLEIIADGRYMKMLEYMSFLNYRAYFARESGYLPKIFRDALFEEFCKKERLPKGTLERHFSKTKVNILYGKGIQDHHLQNIEEVKQHYRGYKRGGNNYITHEQSLHCIAKTRYMLKRAILYLSGRVVYYDTDGIKVTSTVEAVNYFYDENKRIYEENIKAGYDSLIGTWEFEGRVDELLVIGKKQYVIRKGDEYIFTLAGVQEECKNNMLETYGNKNIIRKMRKYGVFMEYINVVYDEKTDMLIKQPSANIIKWNGRII